MERLADCKVGQNKKIVRIDPKAPIKIRRRLLELGWTNGQRVKILRRSFFGQTFLIEIRFFCLSVRKNLAEYVFVE